MNFISLNSTISINVQDLLLGLLVIAGIAVLVILFVILIRVLGTLGKVNRMLDDVTVPLKGTTAELPAMADRKSVV